MKETGYSTEICKGFYIPHENIRLPATSLPPLMQKILRIGSICFTQRSFRNIGHPFPPLNRFNHTCKIPLMMSVLDYATHCILWTLHEINWKEKHLSTTSCGLTKVREQSSTFSSTRIKKKKSKYCCLALKILVFEVVMYKDTHTYDCTWSESVKWLPNEQIPIGGSRGRSCLL